MFLVALRYSFTVIYVYLRRRRFFFFFFWLYHLLQAIKRVDDAQLYELQRKRCCVVSNHRLQWMTVFVDCREILLKAQKLQRRHKQ